MNRSFKNTASGSAIFVLFFFFLTRLSKLNINVWARRLNVKTLLWVRRATGFGATLLKFLVKNKGNIRRVGSGDHFI